MTRLSPCLDSIDPAALCRCGNCDTETRLDKLDSISDAQLRVTPGEETPAGECPECGALAYLVTPKPAATVPPATVYIVTREACELTDWETESEAFASEPDARAYARKAAHDFAKTEEVQEWLIPGGEPLEIVELGDGYRVDDGNNVNVMFQVHACPVAPVASEPNPLASMLSECVEALEFQIMGDDEEHSRTQRDIIERAKALLPASPVAAGDEETGHCVRRHFECSECGESWSDDWDCGCNDRCPGCDAETEPHTVENIEPEECNGCPACDQEGES